MWVCVPVTTAKGVHSGVHMPAAFSVVIPPFAVPELLTIIYLCSICKIDFKILYKYTSVWDWLFSISIAPGRCIKVLPSMYPLLLPSNLSRLSENVRYAIITRLKHFFKFLTIVNKTVTNICEN